jgi:SAM-dependent methyltransferase
MIPDKAFEMNGNPSRWVRRFAPLIAPGGRVLDLACGSGRHSLFLAAEGFRVEAVDRDAAAIAALAPLDPRVSARVADIEGGPWPYYGHVFDAVVVTNYLFRPLLPLIMNALDLNGVLIYETFMVGNERFGKPSNPAFLLRQGELLDVLRPKLNVVAFEQGEVELPRPAVVQRICAVRGLPRSLPEPPPFVAA